MPFVFAACGLSPFASPAGSSTSSGGGSTASSGGATSSAGGTTTSAGGATSSAGGSTSSTGGGGMTTSGSGGGTMSTGGSGGTTSGAGGAMGGAGGASSGSAGATSGTGGIATGTGGMASGSTGGSGGATSGTGGSGGLAVDAGDGDASDGSAANDAAEASACGAVETLYPLEPGIHVAVCAPITYSTNPPTSGMHYPIWAAFKSYSLPVPRGFYVHSMEHGAVVFEHNCASNCDADIAALQAYLAARPADPLCLAPLTNRFIVTPDPLLDVPFAVSAWGASLKMQCLDFAAIGAFIDAHYGKAPENFCFDGTDVTAADGGIPGGCGQPTDAGSD